MKKWSWGVTYLFHPLFIPSILGGLILFNDDFVQWLDTKTRVYILILIVIMTILLPISWLLVTKNLEAGKSWLMEKQRDRLKPLLVQSVSVFFLTYMFVEKLKVSEFISAIYLSIGVSLTIAFILTLFYKVSLHALGWGGFLGVLSAIWTSFYIGGAGFQMALWVGFLVLGGVMTARLYLRAHSVFEVYSGAILGFIACFATSFIYIQ